MVSFVGSLMNRAGSTLSKEARDVGREGDFRPYVYRSGEFGAVWTPLHDMVIHPREKDLVLGTHGRSIIILDDIGPLARYGATTADAAALSETRLGTIMNYWKDTSYRAQSVFMGDNPVDGTLVTYRLGPGTGPARPTVRNAAGDVVRELGIPSAPGLHRVDWDLRHALPGADGSEWAAHNPTVAPPHPGPARTLRVAGPSRSRTTGNCRSRSGTPRRSRTTRRDAPENADPAGTAPRY